jgi:putative DNA methylase
VGRQAYADASGCVFDLRSRWRRDYNYWSLGLPTPADHSSTFARQALPDGLGLFAEAIPFGGTSGDFSVSLESSGYSIFGLDALPAKPGRVCSQQADAAQQSVTAAKVVSTDPPYYDNIGYADLSDFFYVWLRRACGQLSRAVCHAGSAKG